MKALVCGAGVGGLSAGIALLRSGFDVTVFEQGKALRATGAGLNLWPNAGRALYSLGLRAQYDELAVPLARYITMKSDGQVVCEVDVGGWGETYGAPATGVYRWGLTTMLAEALGLERIRFHHKLAMVRDEGGRVTCTFSNGVSETGDLLIGADGIHSTTRANLYGEPTYRPNEYHADRWRGLVRLDDVDFDAHAETEVFGDDGSFFGTVPIGGGLGYWFASGPGIGSREELAQRFGGWAATHVPSTIEATIDGEVLRTTLFDLADLPERWSHGRVTLLGDAAHAMMPDLAQGASQTFVDSVALAQSLDGDVDVVRGLQEYEELRRSDAYRAVRLSRRGMFTGSGAGHRRIDPIALRYQRGIEGADES